MGLKERRLMQQITETTIPEAVSALKTQCGEEIAIDVDWSGFETDAVALERLPSQCFDRTVTAITWLCQDDIGKEAVRNGLKRIVIQNVPTPAERRLHLENGTLTVCGVWNSSHWDGLYHQSEIHKFLETHL